MTHFPAFLRRISALIRQPVFISLALIGNSIIFLGGFALYSIEYGTNPKIHSFLDALWWSVATVTTVGYGDVSPVTVAGKCMGIALMLLGTTLFCSFTALFAATLVSGQLEGVEHGVKKLKRELRSDEEMLDHHLLEIEDTLKKLRGLLRGGAKPRP